MLIYPYNPYDPHNPYHPSPMTIQPLILSAGKGVRMASAVPKLLMPIANRPMIAYLLDTLQKADFVLPPAIVVSPNSPLKEFIGSKWTYIMQEQARGTGDAVRSAKAQLQGKSDAVMVLYADNPFVSVATLRAITQQHQATHATVSMATLTVQDFHGPYAAFYDFGHIVRNPQGSLQKIVELKDATPKERDIREVNCGMYCIESAWLWSHIDTLSPSPVTDEYYVTDLIEMVT